MTFARHLVSLLLNISKKQYVFDIFANRILHVLMKCQLSNQKVKVRNKLQDISRTDVYTNKDDLKSAGNMISLYFINLCQIFHESQKQTL